MYLKILIFATGILLMFRALAHLNRLLPLSKRVKHITSYLLPAIEIATWTGFAIWSLHYIYDAEAYYILIVLGILIVLLLIPTWFLARDFLYGMFLKIQRKIEVDSKIETTEFEGIVTKTDYFTFDIQCSNGNIKTVPYNKIRSEIVTKNAANIHLLKQKFTFIFPMPKDRNLLLSKLKNALVNAPWTAASQEPIVDDIKTENNNLVIDVMVWVIDKNHTNKIADWVYQNCKTN
jgi:small-conductance mechanosensitive channel